jgi:hypothetical protein
LILFEIDRLTWNSLEPWIARGQLPNFARIRAEGVWGNAHSGDAVGSLDRWVTWATLHSGRPQSEHRVQFLDQPQQTIKAKRIWELCNDAGLSVGVYGSLNSSAPLGMRGFFLPSTSSPKAYVFPRSLRLIQAMNVERRFLQSARAGVRLQRLGLRTKTLARLLGRLAIERLKPASTPATLKPLIDIDLFEALYRKHRPDFATFHVAPPPAQDHRITDEILGRLDALVDDRTVLVVASAIGPRLPAPPRGMFILHGPGVPTDHLTDMRDIDFVPTMLGLLAVPPPAELRGTDILASAPARTAEGEDADIAEAAPLQVRALQRRLCIASRPTSIQRPGNTPSWSTAATASTSPSANCRDQVAVTTGPGSGTSRM